eukprot:6176377-Pleurochrysis_carterae.AAC.1
MALSTFKLVPICIMSVTTRSPNINSACPLRNSLLATRIARRRQRIRKCPRLVSLKTGCKSATRLSSRYMLSDYRFTVPSKHSKQLAEKGSGRERHA